MSLVDGLAGTPFDFRPLPIAMQITELLRFYLLCIQELLAHIFIGLQPLFMPKNGLFELFLAQELDFGRPSCAIADSAS